MQIHARYDVQAYIDDIQQQKVLNSPPSVEHDSIKACLLFKAASSLNMAM